MYSQYHLEYLPADYSTEFFRCYFWVPPFRARILLWILCRSSGVCIFHSNWRLWTIRNISSISNFIINYLILWLLIRSAITKMIYGNTKRWPETVYKFIYVLYPPIYPTMTYRLNRKLYCCFNDISTSAIKNPTSSGNSSTTTSTVVCFFHCHQPIATIFGCRSPGSLVVYDCLFGFNPPSMGGFWESSPEPSFSLGNCISTICGAALCRTGSQPCSIDSFELACGVHWSSVPFSGVTFTSPGSDTMVGSVYQRACLDLLGI